MSYEPISWRPVFERWLRARPVLDRIDFADVARFAGQSRYFEYSGPIITVRNP